MKMIDKAMEDPRAKEEKYSEETIKTLFCPSEFGLDEQDNCPAEYLSKAPCDECWNREYVPEESPEPTDDSMRHFDTGAVRDSATGKGRFDLLPWGAIHALAKHCERGALHYGERNVDKGIKQSSFMDSALRHICQYIQGDAEDYHLVAALWNIAWACEQELKRPEMIDLPERGARAGKAV